MTQTKHMRVVKAVGLYEHAARCIDRNRTYRTSPFSASEIKASVPCRVGERGGACGEPTANDEM